MKSKLAGRTVAILGLSLLALILLRPETASGAILHYEPWLIPRDKDATKMTIMVETDAGVDCDYNHRRIHFTYDADSPEPNWSWSCTDIPDYLIGRTLFKIDVSNLNPGHYYQFTFSYRDWHISNWNTVSGGFQATRNMASPANWHVEFMALGDNRGATGGDVPDLIRWVMADAHNIYNFNPEFMVHTGDIAFNGGNTLSWNFPLPDYWYDFFNPWGWLLERYPIMAALGNHDFDINDHAGQHSDYADMTNFHTYFPYPHALPGGVGDSYTYNVNGQAWFFSLDTYPIWNSYCGPSGNNQSDNLQPDSEQYQWLDRTLSALDNDPRQWKIVLMHAPLYSPGDCNLHEGNASLEALFEKHGVDLVLAGHEHYYSRIAVPVSDPSNSPNPDTVHLVLGGAGATLSGWNNATGYDRALEINHFANISIDGDVLDGSIVSADDTDSSKRGDIVDSFTINRTPVADFSYTASSGYTVSFSDISKGHRYQYLWDFGDGNTSTARNPAHTYRNAGTYNVTLTIKSMWNQSSVTQPVNIRTDLTGEWSFLTQVCKPTMKENWFFKPTKKGNQCKITGTFIVKNIGKHNAPHSNVKFYLSEDNAYDKGDAFLEKVRVRKIKVNRSERIKLTYELKLPLGSTASGKYIIAVVDADNTVVEDSESNNIIAYQIP